MLKAFGQGLRGGKSLKYEGMVEFLFSELDSKS